MARISGKPVSRGRAVGRPPAPDAGPKLPVGGRQDEGRPRLALPGDLPLSLSYLDDDQLDALLRATTAEARRRGWKVGEVRPAARVREERATSRRSPGADAAAGRTAAISPGQEKIVRAALEAGGGSWHGGVAASCSAIFGSMSATPASAVFQRASSSAATRRLTTRAVRRAGRRARHFSAGDRGRSRSPPRSARARPTG